MKSMSRIYVAVATLILLSGPGIASATGSDAATQWPSELEQQLAHLDAQLVEVQQKLFTAKQTNDVAGTDRYTAEFNACQTQRLAILQSLGLVSPSDLGNED